ncbi:MAG: PHP domain-containing protein [Patescibacteria group bacterium]|nr:PHP domain-containing protein [Patescibacteria group bacterium]
MKGYPIDLHSHSWCSDGNCSPTKLAERAAEAGMELVVLTDHGTISGFEEFEAACRRLRIETMPGVEIRTQYRGLQFDVLGYGLDPAHAAVAKVLDAQQLAEAANMAWYVERSCPGVTVEDILHHAGVPGPLTAPCWIRKFQREVLGLTIADIERQSHEMKGERDAQKLAFCQQHLATFAQVAEAVHAAGGIISFAHAHETGIHLFPEHPKSYQRLDRSLDLAGRLIPLGLDAIELRHNSHHDGLVDMIRRHHFPSPLLFTGGSDFHGDRPGEHKPGVCFGSSGLTAREFRPLRCALYRQRAAVGLR